MKDTISEQGVLAPQVVEGSFDDIDALAAAALDWDQEYQQLGRGKFKGRLRQLVLGRRVGWMCQRAARRIEPQLQEQLGGGAPEGLRTAQIESSRLASIDCWHARRRLQPCRPGAKRR